MAVISKWYYVKFPPDAYVYSNTPKQLFDVV